MKNAEAASALREAFMKNALMNLDDLRETVAKSWLRSRLSSVNPAGLIAKNKSDAAFCGMRAVNKRPELFEYIFSHAESTYRENYRSDMVVVVTDARGDITRLCGCEKALEELERIGLAENASLAENAVGTNAIGTCLYTRKPVYICRDEHYKDVLCAFTSYGAPIFDERNEVVAVFGVLFRGGEPDFTWLNLINQTVSSISKECLIYHQRHDLQDLQANFDRLINTMNYGIVLLDEEARIVKANSIARYFFLMYEYELIGQHITNFISPQDIDFPLLQNDIYEQSVCIHSGEVKKFTFLASVYLTSTWNNRRNYLLVFNKAPGKEPSSPDGVLAQSAKWRFNDIVGSSSALTETIDFARIASKTSCTVLITGESGVGKELFAQAIHNASSCANGPFIPVNCGAIPKGLAESELFGYENGAFTGAKRTGMPGKFELANGGTIFLDEIGDMSLELQICLLRFLQEQEVTRVGGKKPIKVNVRVIAATNKNLEEAINNSAFRMDLYYRLNVFNIHVPPLRERAHDIGNLAHYFLQKYKIRSNQPFVGFTPEALSALQNYSWPGNVRELENTVERAVIISRSDRIRLDDLPEKIRTCYSQREIENIKGPEAAEQPVSFPVSAEQTEMDVLIRALRSTQGNVTKAASMVGISRRTMYRKMEKYGIGS